jgi:hypothetical protein
MTDFDTELVQPDESQLYPLTGFAVLENLDNGIYQLNSVTQTQITLYNVISGFIELQPSDKLFSPISEWKVYQE